MVLLVPLAVAMLSKKGVCPEVLKILKSFPSVTRRGKMSVFLGQLPAAANMQVTYLRAVGNTSLDRAPKCTQLHSGKQRKQRDNSVEA